MYFNGSITFNNITSASLGLIVTEPPKIEHSAILGDEYNIPGRNGVLYGKNTYRSSAAITVKMALVKPDYESGYTSASYQTALRSIRTWLQGTGNLIIGDVSDSYYEVQRVEITTDERVIVNYGTLEVKFTVYPCEFLTAMTVSGHTINANSSYTFTLPTDFSEPEYAATLVGSGTESAYFVVNGKRFTVTSPTADIDTRRKTAIRGGVSVSNAVSGDYDAIKLKHGSNTIQTSAGMQLKVWSRDGYII